jgi:AhpD family alkylhydroperoxidase
MALAIGIAVHCDGCVAYHTKMAHQHGATREEVAETVALAVYMGGGPAAVYGGGALRAYEVSRNLSYMSHPRPNWPKERSEVCRDWLAASALRSICRSSS